MGAGATWAMVLTAAGRVALSLLLAASPAAAQDAPPPESGRVYDDEEMVHLVDSALDFWLTTGRYAKKLERGLARFVGTRHALLCNSGSSANLLAVSALTSPKLERGPTRADVVAMLPAMRAAAAPFPRDPSVLALLSEAENRAGNRAEGGARATLTLPLAV